MQDAAKLLDEQLKLIASGDKSALAALYKCASASVYAYSLSVLRSTHDAEDALSEVFLEIWRAAGTYKSRGKPMAWIITIAKNVCLMKLRSRRFFADEPLDASLHKEMSPGLGTEESLVLKSCLEELKDDERQIVILHAVSGLKHRETAKLLGLPLSTVLSKYNRAIKKLRHTLQDTTEGEAL